MTASEPNPAVVADRLARLEARVEAGFAHVDERLERLSTSLRADIQSIAYVRRDVYDSDQEYMRARIKVAEERSDAAQHTARWCIGVTLSSFTILTGLAVILRGVLGG